MLYHVSSETIQRKDSSFLLHETMSLVASFVGISLTASIAHIVVAAARHVLLLRCHATKIVEARAEIRVDWIG